MFTSQCFDINKHPWNHFYNQDSWIYLQHPQKFPHAVVLNSGWSKVAMHRHSPTTDQPGGFDLLHCWPGPFYPSLGNLVGPCSREVTILRLNLVWYPVEIEHSQMPELLGSVDPLAPATWVQPPQCLSDGFVDYNWHHNQMEYQELQN